MNSSEHSENEKNAISFLYEHGLLLLLCMSDTHKKGKAGISACLLQITSLMVTKILYVMQVPWDNLCFLLIAYGFTI